jgi:hypothetical protein
MKNDESLADLELQSNCLYCNNLDLRLIEEELQKDEDISASHQSPSPAEVMLSKSKDGIDNASG